MAWFIPLVGFDSWQCCIYPQGSTWRVKPHTWGGLPWWRRFQSLRYQGSYRTELLPSLTTEWLETSPSNTGVEGSNFRGLKCDNREGYIGSWIYPEYSVAWLIPVVGFDSWQCCIYPQGTWIVKPRTSGGLPWCHWWRKFQALSYQGCYHSGLLPSWTAEWLETSPPNTGVEGSNPRGLKCDYKKWYISGWIYPEYSWHGWYPL